jgi:hypothetical protein
MYRWSRGLAAAAVALAALADRANAAVTEQGDYVHPGIYYGVRVDDAIPVRVHVVEIDLSSAEIRLRATSEAERGQRTSTWATAAGVAVAINGDLFAPLDFTPAGLARGGPIGSLGTWGISADNALEALLVFDRASNVNHAHVSPPEQVVEASSLDPLVEGVVGGRPMLVRAGVAVTGFDCADQVAMPCERAPRSAVGVSANGRTLILVVVDGWQPGSLGWTAAELAAFMDARGAYDAIALDPGASSTLVVPARGGVVSSPSDGAERVVANHLGVVYGALPPGSMVGFVKEMDVFNGPPIEGAKVALDTGASVTTGADGRYSFVSLTPRYTCATASAPGYQTVTQCRTVPSNQMIFNSIALFPASAVPDAGPTTPDAAVEPPADAGPSPDAPSAGDAGDNPGDDEPGTGGTCGCTVGGRASNDALLPCLLAGFLVMLLTARRRPGKKGP